VKRSAGGLRDIQLVRWLALALHEAESLDDLQLTGGMSRRDVEALKTAADFLMRVRNDLHLASGKAADDLTRDQQLRIAQARGIESRGGLLGVERFMRDYFGHTRRVAQILEAVEQRGVQPSVFRRLATGVLGHRVEGLYLVGPRAVAAAPGCVDRVAGSLAAIVRLVELALLYRMPIDPATWEAVREGVPALPREADAAAKEVFLRLFTQADGLAEADLTAACLLAMEYAGGKSDAPELMAGCDYLAGRAPAVGAARAECSPLFLLFAGALSAAAQTS
jgi:[protein-PII] uridylyltransferase